MPPQNMYSYHDDMNVNVDDDADADANGTGTHLLKQPTNHPPSSLSATSQTQKLLTIRSSTPTACNYNQNIIYNIYGNRRWH